MRLRKVQKGFTKIKSIAATVSAVATAGLIVTAVIRKIKK